MWTDALKPWARWAHPNREDPNTGSQHWTISDDFIPEVSKCQCLNVHRHTRTDVQHRTLGTNRDLKPWVNLFTSKCFDLHLQRFLLFFNLGMTCTILGKRMRMLVPMVSHFCKALHSHLMESQLLANRCFWKLVKTRMILGILSIILENLRFQTVGTTLWTWDRTNRNQTLKTWQTVASNTGAFEVRRGPKRPTEFLWRDLWMHQLWKSCATVQLPYQLWCQCSS